MIAYLIRHCTSANQAPEAPLSAEGETQAKALISLLRGLGAGPLYASPYRRAVATIAPYAQATDQLVTELPGLAERRLSPVPLPDWQDHIKRSFLDTDYAPEGGESHNDLLTRATPELVQIEKHGGDRPAFVTHGGMTAALFHACDPSFGFAGWQSLRNPDVFQVSLANGQIENFERIELEMHK